MTTDDLLQALARLRVETGSLACLGCGHEHNCSTHGCQILRKAAARLKYLETEKAALLTLAKNANECTECKNYNSCERFGELEGLCALCGSATKCPCYGCRGERWQWRGLPEAPEEGEKA